MDEKETMKMLEQFQAYQSQLQSVMMQKSTLQLQLIEIDKAIEELDSTKNENAYKITGQIMVSKPVSEIKTDLSETKEALELRANSLEKSGERLTAKLKEMETELSKLVK